jgi:demethylmenaquinone methyltransferase/2-methoxy-6-polyprenyl-1,4-benzoquinol methylase
MKKTFLNNMQHWLINPVQKKHHVRQMFSHIAPKYNVAVCLLSFCQDRKWKKQLVENLQESSKAVCVDLACGTGDITFLLAQKYSGQITGVDISDKMLEIAQKNNRYPHVSFLNCDMGSLQQFPDNSVDVITGGYALRNAADLNQALKEIYRILKPGGYASFLEFSKGSNSFQQKLQYVLLKTWGSFWGIVLHANYKVYAYLAESLKVFPDRHVLRKNFYDVGFRNYVSALKLGGMLEVIRCEKL